MMGGKTLLSRFIDLLVAEAVASFGKEDGTEMFNTAGFQSAVEKRFPEIGIPDGADVEALLKTQPRIVQLNGGCHWFVLPNEMCRQMPR